MTFEETIKNNWDHISKPIDGFGDFERLYAKIASIQKKDPADLSHMKLIVFCADHGIVEEGVSQCGKEVTRSCAENIGKGLTSAGVMAGSLGIKIEAVDVGIDSDGPVDGTEFSRVRRGTRNFLKAPAMTLEEFEQALSVGKNCARNAKEEGITILLSGEMGIGNTTSAAIVAGYLLRCFGTGLEASELCGRGAGLSDEGLERKRSVVRKALSMHESLSADDAMRLFGGLELVAMSGMMKEAAKLDIPVILDGMLSHVCALYSVMTEPRVKDILIPSHMTKEPLCRALLSALSLSAPIDGKMATGEGTGALMLVPLLRLSGEVYEKALKFGESGVEQYERFK